MATTEVYKYPDSTVIVTFPYDTPEEKAEWEERVKKATAKFVRTVYREMEEKERREKKKEKIVTLTSEVANG